MPTHWQYWTLGIVIAVITCARVAEAQQAPRLGKQPPEERLQLPEIKVIAPARLSGLPLPLSEVPAAVQVITGEELRQSGGVTLQESLTRLPGVTLNDEQGNAVQPGISLHGFQARPIPWFEVDLALFRTDVRDDIFAVSPTGTVGLFFQNIGDTRRQGLELSLRGTYKRLLDATVAPNARRPGAPVERFLTPAPPIHVLAGISYQF